MDRVRQHKPEIIAVDGNLSEETLKAIVKHTTEQDIPSKDTSYFY